MVRNENGWHTYHLRKMRPAVPFSRLLSYFQALRRAIGYGMACQPGLWSKPLRRMLAIRWRT